VRLSLHKENDRWYIKEQEDFYHPDVRRSSPSIVKPLYLPSAVLGFHGAFDPSASCTHSTCTPLRVFKLKYLGKDSADNVRLVEMIIPFLRLHH
jgi:hypothetical protein